ncbi:MAG: MBL fold metallo-hydrolase [Clostridium sp.]|nr:MBL fold metallo-hydrolase [Clostridium sp.]
MEIQKLALGMFQANCYVVSEGNEAFLVDPGDRPEEILDYLNNHGLDLKFILLTHGHLDHVNAVDGIVKVHKVPVYLHEADRKAIDQKVNVFG